MNLAQSVCKELSHVSKKLGHKEKDFEALQFDYDILQSEHKENSEAYSKLRMHNNKVAADKKQLEKELEHFEKVLNAENRG